MPDPRLLAHLAELGATEAQLSSYTDNHDLIGLAGDLQFAVGLGLTLNDLARVTDCGIDELRSIYAQIGLRADDLAGFGDADVALVSLIINDTSGIVEQLGPQILRVIGTLLARLAEAMVAGYVQDIESPDEISADLVAAADQNASAAMLALTVGEHLPSMFRHHMLTAVRRQRGEQAEVTEREYLRLAIGFVDLVGFTSLSRSLPPATLIATIEDFEHRAFESATRHGGRIIKSIGDEVMVAASEASVVAAIALELIDSTGDDQAVAPRAGVSAGDVLFRLGDYYGPVVNLASRLTAEAIPGEVLTDLDGLDGSDFVVRPAGRRQLTGFAEPVAVSSIESAPRD
jgi:adenylate cyclase